MNANVEMFAAIAVTGVGLLLALVSFVSWRRLRHPRALLIGLAFLAFALQGAWLVRESWRLRAGEAWLLTVSVFDLAVLVLLYLALRLP